MKTFLISFILLCLIQTILWFITIYKMEPSIKTVGDLIKVAKEMKWFIWLPIVGLILNIVLWLSHVWVKLLRIKIRKH